MTANMLIKGPFRLEVGDGASFITAPVEPSAATKQAAPPAKPFYWKVLQAPADMSHAQLEDLVKTLNSGFVARSA